jgi:hypothetical protein
MRDMKYVHTMLVEKPREERPLRRLSRRGIILKRIIGKFGRKVWSGFI